MNLVEKINQVKIKADTRISGADRAFCERQQRAYDAAREALRELDFTWTDCISQQKMILDGEQAYTYYLGNDRNLKTACFRDELERLHEHFINRLTSYFAHTYSVDLSAQSITERLLPSNSSKGIFEREKQKKQRLHTIKPCVSLRCDTPTCWIRSSFSLVDAVFRKERSGKYSSAAAAQYGTHTKTNRSMFSKRISFIFIVTSASVTQIGHRRAGV